MTISQARLHAACEAGRAILTAYEHKTNKAAELRAAIRRGALGEGIRDNALLLGYLELLAEQDPLIAERTRLATEASHYAATARKNARSQLSREREGKPRPTSEITRLAPSVPSAPHAPTPAFIEPEYRLSETERAETEQTSALMGVEKQVRGLLASGLDSTAQTILDAHGLEWSADGTRLQQRGSGQPTGGPQSEPNDDENWGDL